ncbi:MAG: hypothetical protein ACMUJM_07375 [bacterium]
MNNGTALYTAESKPVKIAIFREVLGIDLIRMIFSSIEISPITITAHFTRPTAITIISFAFFRESKICIQRGLIT